MPKYIKKKHLKRAIEECTWYHINKNGELVEGANSAEHEPLYKYSDIKRIIKGLPTKKFEDEPQTIRCPKCGRSDYIREFGKDFSVTAEESGFKYKCINCNTYIEPQTERNKR